MSTRADAVGVDVGELGRVGRAIRSEIPLARFGETDELAGVVTFLLSPAAAYITGAVLRVDGGIGLFKGLAR